jgi:hypothetical protein
MFNLGLKTIFNPQFIFGFILYLLYNYMFINYMHVNIPYQ